MGWGEEPVVVSQLGGEVPVFVSESSWGTAVTTWLELQG